jgi:hypothetical protein
MFAYKDPTGLTVLENQGALNNYRGLVDGQYQRARRELNSAFASLDDFEQVTPGAQVRDAAVEWHAFPISRLGVSDEQFDRSRDQTQDEYVEWRVEKSSNRVTRVTFTTEFREYWLALAAVGFEQLVAGIKAIDNTANPTLEELYGTSSPAELNTPRKRFNAFDGHLRSNPWNNGSRGILCLIQGANTIGALFTLVMQCATPRPEMPVGSVCGVSNCGSNRDSDPKICAACQTFARAGDALTLADPVGIEIFRMDGVWELDGALVNISTRSDLWQVSRNGRRAVLNVPTGLTLDGEEIITGAQVSRSVTVRAKVLLVKDTELPVFARRGQEGTRLT